MRKMTLEKHLEGIENKATKIKIGAANGSSFFYCGTVEDFTANADKYEELNISHWDIRVDRANDKLDKELNEDTSYSGYTKAQFRRWKSTNTRPNFTMDGYEHFLKDHAKLLEQKFQTLINERKGRADRVALMSRVVTDSFLANTTIEPDETRVIMVEGTERGAFWTTSEAGEPTMRYGGNNDDSEGSEE